MKACYYCGDIPTHQDDIVEWTAIAGGRIMRVVQCRFVQACNIRRRSE